MPTEAPPPDKTPPPERDTVPRIAATWALRHPASSLFALAILSLFVLPAIAGDMKLPITDLPRVQSLPDSRPLLLEIRERDGGCMGGEEKTQSGDCPRGGIRLNEFAILEIGTGNESAWELPAFPADLVSDRDSICSEYNAREVARAVRGYSWAFDASRLLYVGCAAAYLVRADGIFERLNIPMPGKLKPYQGTLQYSVSSDATRISYAVYVRDPNDKQPDGSGSLYRDLVVQDVSGFAPVTVSKDNTTKYHGSLSPDGSHIAYYSETDETLKIAAIKGGGIQRIKVPGEINVVTHKPEVEEIRWSPDGTKLAVISTRNLYVLRLPETAFVRVIHNDKVGHIASFAWSPDSHELAFRSSHEGKQTCSYGPYFDGAEFALKLKRCANAYQLYAVDVETGDTRLLKASEEYRPKQLYWIR